MTFFFKNSHDICWHDPQKPDLERPHLYFTPLPFHWHLPKAFRTKGEVCAAFSARPRRALLTCDLPSHSGTKFRPGVPPPSSRDPYRRPDQPGSKPNTPHVCPLPQVPKNSPANNTIKLLNLPCTTGRI